LLKKVLHCFFHCIVFEEYYGVGGPIDVIVNDLPSRLLPYWLQAGHELGFKIADSNAHQSEC
jgi:hypothetical protein